MANPETSVNPDWLIDYKTYLASHIAVMQTVEATTQPEEYEGEQ